MGFFDAYPRFFQTSQVGTNPNRLNKRHQAIFETDPNLCRGARVLDIASHDGRWSLAALHAGAASVVGVEARTRLVKCANETLKCYGFDPQQYRFVEANIFEWAPKSDERFDVVLCLGFLYHTFRHPELLAIIAKCRPRAVVLDTLVYRSEGPICFVNSEPVAAEAHSIADPSSNNGMAYVAKPTPRLAKDYLTNLGFSVAEVDWRSLIARDGNTEGIEDYSRGERMTFIARRGAEN